MNRDHERTHAEVVGGPLYDITVPTPLGGCRSRHPHERHWIRAEFQLPFSPVSASAWQRGRVFVISTVELAEYPDASGESGPQWHLSASKRTERCTDTEMLRVRRAFGLLDAEEDNHHPGIARHLWLPIDPARRTGCECKVSEVVVTEPDGYEWTNPRPGDGDCRGCEIAPVTGKPCPLHGATP